MAIDKDALREAITQAAVASDTLAPDVPVSQELMTAVRRLDKDIRAAAAALDAQQARFLVDRYYLVQGLRIRAQAQLRAMTGEPNAVLQWFLDTFETLEGDVKNALQVFAKKQRAGRWLLAQKGIGPVLAAGLLAYVDLSGPDFRDGKTFSNPAKIWRYAGYDPTLVWEKGKKRPWNAALKTLGWKASESFVKVSNAPDAYYGKLYKSQRQILGERNDAGGFQERAAQWLAKKRFSEETEAYKANIQGKLSNGHLHAMAKRYTSKRLFSHYWEVCWCIAHPGEQPPANYAVAHLGHIDHDDPPHWPID